MGLPTNAAPTLLILKLAGQQCNIDCVYCYERRKPETSGHLSAELVRKLIDKFPSSAQLSILLHGGEPLLIAPARMAQILEVVSAAPNVSSVSIQTNGTLITPKWLQLFGELLPTLHWGISYDGPRDQSRYRIDHSGRVTESATERGIRTLDDAGIRFGLITVVNASHGDDPQAAQSLFDAVARYRNLSSVKLVPCLDAQVAPSARRTKSGSIQRNLLAQAGGGSPWAIEPGQFADFVLRYQDLWIDSGAWRRYRLDPTEAIVRNLRGMAANYLDYEGGQDYRLVTLYPDGTITAHDREDESQSGVIELDTVDSIVDWIDHTRRDMQTEWDSIYAPMCDGCVWAKGCGGSELFTRRSMLNQGIHDDFCRSRGSMVDALSARVGQTVK